MSILPETQISWFCIRSQPKHEMIAAANLRANPELEVFLPRIRFRRATRTGQMWVTEALFINYLFVRFEFPARLRMVQAARGVKQVLQFGTQYATVPDQAVEDLRKLVDASELITVDQDFVPGDSVEIKGGIFEGLHGVVSRTLPGPKRVAVLLEFLGRQTSVEFDHNCLVRHENVRLIHTGIRQ